ncbi:mechanosensitive ion channel family protein [Paenimyroides aestuarii]|uniref:Mechanosensitive ion channel n=1 Tax=Paenimyroides aestuarii TaxID=2968490 RepID=A0ABY5NVR9_9FLAO|nr:mechanosensitive ion channel family protein [Paenimyroides aestuarii]UUV22519.1 mechanosensitive ion channel [Paenimyroides aestuarii]
MNEYLNRATVAIEDLVKDIIEYTPNIILALLVCLLSFYLSNRVKKATEKILLKRNIKHSARNVIANMTSFATILGGLYLMLSIMNLSDFIKALLGAAGLIGLAVSLALQSTLSNTFAGIVLSFIKTIKIGDWIETNGYAGEVQEINLRVTTLLLADGNILTIPNKLLIENTLKNYSLTENSIISLQCGIDYNSDLQFVEDLVVNTIKSELPCYVPGTKVPFFYYEFADSSINFEVRFQSKSGRAIEIAQFKGLAIKLIHKKFKEHNINIPFPIRSLEVRNSK